MLLAVMRHGHHHVQRLHERHCLKVNPSSCAEEAQGWYIEHESCLNGATVYITLAAACASKGMYAIYKDFHGHCEYPSGYAENGD